MTTSRYRLTTNRHKMSNLTTGAFFKHGVLCLGVFFFSPMTLSDLPRDDRGCRGREGEGERGRRRVRRVNLLSSSNLISCGSQCSDVQREGRNGSHLPSIIALLESSVMRSGWMITSPAHLSSAHFHLCCSLVTAHKINGEI